MRLAALCLVAVLGGCSDDDKPYSASVAFPSATDTWPGLVGVLGEGESVVGARVAGGATRAVLVNLRFGGTGLNCAPNISVSADFGGRTVVANLLPPQGALGASATLQFPTTVSGTVTLSVKLVGSDCGPIGISTGESTVRFEG